MKSSKKAKVVVVEHRGKFDDVQLYMVIWEGRGQDEGRTVDVIYGWPPIPEDSTRTMSLKSILNS